MPLFHKNLAVGMFIEKNFTFVYTEFLFLVLLFLGTNFIILIYIQIVFLH